MATARSVILLVGYFAFSALAIPTSRIWGGEEADKNGFSYVASVRLDGAHICGGSIIESRSILTAAHCVVENNQEVSSKRLAVRVGSTNQYSGGKLYYVSNVSIHPDYTGLKNDIAVLKLELPLEWTDRIAVIDIATSSKDEPVAGDLVNVAGWGEQFSDVSSPKLHSMPFSLATEEVCKNAYSEKDQSSVCLMHDLKKGSCNGDAGNGAVYKNKLVGVSSFVVGACGSRYPDVFSNVAYFASWIKNVLASS